MTKRQQDFAWAVITALIIAFIVALMRRNRNIIEGIPGVGDVFNYLMPETGGFNMGGITIPGLTLPDLPTLTLPERQQMNAPQTSSCACGTSGRMEFVIEQSPRVDATSVNMLPPAISATYQAPPCVMQTDYRAMTAPGTYAYNFLQPRLKAKHWAELVAAGYPPTITGWVRYVIDMPRGVFGNQNRTADKANLERLAQQYQRCM